MTFRVQRTACSTCIYRKDSPLDLAKLEAEIADPHGGFSGHRICHHSDDVCCRGFWNRHKDEFPVGQIAQRLGLAEFVDADTLAARQPTPSPLPDPVWDDPFHACSFAAFVAEARAVQGWPDPEKTRQRAYRMYEEELARRDCP